MERNCSDEVVQNFKDHITWQVRRVDALLVVSPMVMAVMVGIGTYAPRYRHHPLARFLFHGATALFMPIVSYLVSATNSQSVIGLSVNYHRQTVSASCDMHGRAMYIVEWTCLVQIVGVGTIVVVATDAMEIGRSIAPSALLLVQAIWTCYLVIQTLKWQDFAPSQYALFGLSSMDKVFVIMEPYFLVTIWALMLAKLGCKFCAFFAARKSVALGRNPRLVAGYMSQLHRRHADQASVSQQQPLVVVSDDDELVLPPPLLVMGEDTVSVEKRPHGYCFISRHSATVESMVLVNDKRSLVTIDKIWQLMEGDRVFMRSTTQHLKDVCLSFALFKLLRCRFARYTTVDEAKVRDFFWQGLLLIKEEDHTAAAAERVFNVIADELSFLHDYYYSSLPLFYSRPWLPILSLSTSLFIIGYCIFQAIEEITLIPEVSADVTRQMYCKMECQVGGAPYSAGFGSSVFDTVSYTILLMIVLLAEARDIASYICSNWTKVALICRYVVTNHDSRWQRSRATRKWVGFVLQHCRCKLVNKPLKDRMNLCSILEIHPSKGTTPSFAQLIRRYVPLPANKWCVEVPVAVKSAIIGKLRSSDSEGRRRDLSNGTASLRCLQAPPEVKESLIRACSGEGTADVLLVWHIATNILEARHPATARSSDSDSDNNNNRAVATHLSGYCAYLVAYCPELLPDDDAWSKELYKVVKGDSRRALGGHRAPSPSPEEDYKKLVRLLSAGCRHEVIRNGAKLAEQLVALVQTQDDDEEDVDEGKQAWELLAGFWLEMILYVAPSENLDGHAEAIARGGELITLLWALLTHVGIVTRPLAAAADNDTTVLNFAV